MFPSEHDELVHIKEIRDREMAGLGMKGRNSSIDRGNIFLVFWLKSTQQHS